MMGDIKSISIEQCCFYYKIDTTFVRSLDDHGLIALTRLDQEFFVDYEQLPDLEKFIHLYYDLDINLEGIEAITHLINRVQSLQEEIRKLHNELGKS